MFCMVFCSAKKPTIQMVVTIQMATIQMTVDSSYELNDPSSVYVLSDYRRPNNCLKIRWKFRELGKSGSFFLQIFSSLQPRG